MPELWAFTSYTTCGFEPPLTGSSAGRGLQVDMHRLLHRWPDSTVSHRSRLSLTAPSRNPAGKTPATDERTDP